MSSSLLTLLYMLSLLSRAAYQLYPECSPKHSSWIMLLFCLLSNGSLVTTRHIPTTLALSFPASVHLFMVFLPPGREWAWWWPCPFSTEGIERLSDLKLSHSLFKFYSLKLNLKKIISINSFLISPAICNKNNQCLHSTLKFLWHFIAYGALQSVKAWRGHSGTAVITFRQARKPGIREV